MSAPAPSERDREMARRVHPEDPASADMLAEIIAAAREEGRREERERCARTVESQVRLRGGAEWGLDVDHNDTCRLLASMIRTGE